MSAAASRSAFAAAPAPDQAPAPPSALVSDAGARPSPQETASAPDQRSRAPLPTAIAPEDLAACQAAIRTGSYSFYAASRLLPRRVREPALALYAFCRLADDAVDLTEAKTEAVARLRARLDAVYAGAPRDAAADRAFAAAALASGMPRALPEALLEGFEWDAQERRYKTLSALRAYAARVASSVGAMMCVLMGVRDRDALARACDLGLAMQLTNIARDIGEDAAAGRLYLPLEMMTAEGLDPEAFLADPKPGPEIARVAKALLREAERHYRRAEAGVAALPLDCRTGILAARHIYGAIGERIAAAGYDSVTQRARTSRGAKLSLIALSSLQAAGIAVTPTSAVIHAPPTPETEFLIDAAAESPRRSDPWGDGRFGAFVSALAALEQKDRAARQRG
ncbi:MAG: phytoene/squalene synthase family protein [Pseudomonadota bacterium]